MTAGLRELERTGGTSDPLFAAFLLAHAVNQASGGAVIAPWEIAELGEQAPEWIYAAQALAQRETQAGRLQAARQWEQGVYDTWRNSHPAYRQRM